MIREDARMGQAAAIAGLAGAVTTLGVWLWLTFSWACGDQACRPGNL
jgi:hypothetical protein